jgi:hypothetical protein
MKDERNTLNRFAEEENLDINSLEGNPIDSGEFAFRKDAYQFLVGSNHFNKKLTNILVRTSHVMQTFVPRFSNALITLSNMYSFAKRNNIPNIVLPNHWYMRRGSHNIDNISITNLSPNSQYVARPDDIILAGNFFYIHTLKKLYEPFTHFDSISRLRQFFCLKVDTDPVPKGHLVIHIRSGDLFLHSGTHTGYGQPPLSFYKKVIEIEQPISLALVYENTNNPTINLIIEHAKNLDIPCMTVSSSLVNDINYLLKAETIVVGRGTFMPGVTTVSKNVKRVYFFESGYDVWGKKDLEVIRIRDLDGEYKSNLLKSWKNTPAQKKMMVEYPITSIGL